ncbi:uncharacterized protein LOC144167266 [Haemaphysalis longicornis]
MAARVSGSIFLTCLGLCYLTSGRTLDVCGKNPGIVTAARSAALVSKYAQSCGRTIILGYPFSTTTLLKLAEKACIGVRICYTYHENKWKNVTAHRRALQDCMMSGIRTVFKYRPEFAPMKTEQLESFIDDIESCLPGGPMPTNESLALGVIRQFQKVVAFGRR